MLPSVRSWIMLNKTLVRLWLMDCCDFLIGMNVKSPEWSFIHKNNEITSSPVLIGWVHPVNQKYVPTVPAGLIFNICETGLSDWGGRKNKSVLIPSDQIEATLHYPINRSLRHHILTCCISTAGDAYCPLSITPDRGTEKNFKTGVRRGIDLMMEIRQPAYTTAEIFRRYGETVVFSAIADNWNLPDCLDKLTILSCGNCAAHCSRDLLIGLEDP
jgi:hypothetical protein